MSQPFERKLAIFVLATAGCTTSNGIRSQLEPRAAFDLNCPRDQIQIVQLEGGARLGTFGATGCGKRVRYEASCSYIGSNCLINADTAGTALTPKPSQ